MEKTEIQLKATLRNYENPKIDNWELHFYVEDYTKEEFNIILQFMKKHNLPLNNLD
jgi:hypothetical protein